MSERGRLTIVCREFRPVPRGSLIGFATIHINEIRLTIHDVAVHRHANGARWAQLPARPVVDRNGVAQRDPKTGKVAYQRLFAFDSKAVADAFSHAVIEALLVLVPDALDAEFAA
jgi:hypothetical protein